MKYVEEKKVVNRHMFPSEGANSHPARMRKERDAAGCHCCHTAVSLIGLQTITLWKYKKSSIMLSSLGLRGRSSGTEKQSLGSEKQRGILIVARRSIYETEPAAFASRAVPPGAQGPSWGRRPMNTPGFPGVRGGRSQTSSRNNMNDDLMSDELCWLENKIDLGIATIPPRRFMNAASSHEQLNLSEICLLPSSNGEHHAKNVDFQPPRRQSRRRSQTSTKSHKRSTPFVPRFQNLALHSPKVPVSAVTQVARIPQSPILTAQHRRASRRLLRRQSSWLRQIESRGIE